MKPKKTKNGEIVLSFNKIGKRCILDKNIKAFII